MKQVKGNEGHENSQKTKILYLSPAIGQDFPPAIRPQAPTFSHRNHLYRRRVVGLSALPALLYVK